MNNSIFCNINHKNIINPLTKEEMQSLDSQLASINKFNPTLNASISNYLNQIVQKNVDDHFCSSISLYKSYLTKQKVTKAGFKDALAFLEGSSSFQGNLFVFKLENIEALGKALMYCYKQILLRLNIKSRSSFYSALESSITDRVNIKQRHKEYVKKYSSITLVAFMKIFKKDKDNNRYLPPEMIHLMNIMKKICKLKFELENYDQNSFDLLLMILLNVKWLLRFFDDMEVVVTNDMLLRALHSRYAKDLLFMEVKYNKAIKKINYDKGVSFKRELSFLISNYLNTGEETIGSLNMSMTTINLNKISETSPSGSIFFSDGMSISSSLTNANHISHYSDIISHFSFSFEFIVVLSYFASLWNHIGHLSLSFSEEFSKEISKILKKKYQLDVTNFFFFSFYLKLTKLTELNIEFNSLDFEVFERVFNMIHINKKLTILRLSLFLSEAHYYPAALFKLYQSFETNMKMMATSDTTLNKKLPDNDDIDYMITDHLSGKFTQSIQLLFWGLKWLMLNELCIVIQSPSLINSNEKYSMCLLKFILNLLLLLNESNCQYETVKILAPFIQMNTNRLSDIEDFFEMIDLGKRNFNLRKLSLQVQLYDLPNVGHLLTRNLTAIHIGDFNAKALLYFVEALDDKAFSGRSKLQIISIGVLPMVIKFKDVEVALRMLCNLTMPRLTTIEIRSNLCLEGDEYAKFTFCFNCCFVKNFLFEFNHKSKERVSACMCPIFYYDYYSRVEVIKAYAKFSATIFKTILNFLMRKKEAMLDVTYK